jgi:imidazole glycerol-phosphate synthase subunit HisH
MGSRIAIIDYQMGNLRSVQKAFEHVGFGATITSCPEDVEAADKLVLPGVGAFPDAMRELSRRNLPQPIKDFVHSGRPFLGICLGLQLLFESGHEGGTHAGLGILKGSVERFSGGSFEGESGLKVPHMGWNQVAIRQEGCPLMREIAANDHFYFVHSYYVQPTEARDCWLECSYGHPFCAAIWRDNLFATQFHPEKSQASGLQLLRNFAEL